MIEEKQLIQTGTLFKPHGYKGEINAQLDYPIEFYRIDETALFMDVDGAFVPFFLSSLRPKGSNCLLKFEDLDSLDAVRPYVNKTLYCLKKTLADFLEVEEEELEEEFEDFIGYDVIDSKTGMKIGTVSEIQEAKEYDYLILETETDDALPVPFIDEFVDFIEEKEDGSGLISMILPEGLININQNF